MTDEKSNGGTSGDAGAPSPALRRRASVAEALSLLPEAGGPRFAKVLEHGSLLVEIYAPRGRDPQQAHTRDEAYVVVSGRGQFVNGAERRPFAPGDFLFVPAGVAHRFEDFTQDLVVWVIFYGPEGGEREGVNREP